MSNLDNYVAKIREYIEKNPDMTETEIIMYIYLDLAQRFKFNQDFFFAGNKIKKQIYEEADCAEELNECLESNKIICKSSAYMLEYIFKRLGIQAKTVTDKNDYRRYPHVYNVVKPKDGSEEYIIDLQEDMINIHYHDFTKNFGIAVEQSGRNVVSRHEQEIIHKKLGYISKDNPYTSDYIYLLKEDMGFFDTFYDKLDFVLKHIDPIETQNVEYWERRWKHEKTLNNLFSQDELSKKLHTVEIYKRKDNNEKEYINGFYVNASHNNVIIYMHDKEQCGYKSYSVHDFAKKIIDDKIEYNQGIPGLRTELNKLKMEER